MSKKLGKISSLRFGFGGYQNTQLGISIKITGETWGVCDFYGTWGPKIKCTEHTNWTEQDRDAMYARTVRRIGELLIDAKVDCIRDLEGTPVEVEFEGQEMKSWRVLTEVI